MKMNLNNYGKGDLVKFVRQWSGLTQLEFAKRMGKSKRTIEQYEAGTVNYKINFIPVSVDFMENHMPAANGAYVKVYLL